MGNTSSNPAPALGPALTSSERELATKQWLQGLEDRNHTSESRVAIIALLCPAVYACTSMDITYDSLGDQLLGLCNSDPVRLRMMLRKPFIDGQNPIEWAINNLPPELLRSQVWDKLPPLLGLLLERCEGWKDFPRMVSALHGACCKRDSNNLFQLLNPCSTSKSCTTSIYTVTTQGSEIEFVIRDFPTRMLVDGRIDMRFVFQSRLYSVGFLVGKKSQWMMFFSVVQDHSGMKGTQWRTLHIDLWESNADHSQAVKILDVFKAPVSSWNTFEDANISAALLQNANCFVGSDRVLKGYIRITMP